MMKRIGQIVVLMIALLSKLSISGPITNDLSMIQDLYMVSCMKMGEPMRDFCECSFGELYQQLGTEELHKMLVEMAQEKKEKHVQMVREASLKCKNQLPPYMYLK